MPEGSIFDDLFNDGDGDLFDLGGGKNLFDEEEAPDETAPILGTPVISSDGVTWRLPFSEAVTGTGGFSGVGSTTGALTLTYSSGNGTATHFYTGTEVVPGETVTLDYTPGTLVDDSDNALEAINDMAVLNYAGALPRYSIPRHTLDRHSLARYSLPRYS